MILQSFGLYWIGLNDKKLFVALLMHIMLTQNTPKSYHIYILGLLGVISAVLATIAALGTMMYCGMPFIGINLAAPFLMLGIGIDDTFVMLGAWRRTSLHAPVPERMRETFKDAAVSITITSVTDMLSFFVGVITPFPCVKIFCVYTGKYIEGDGGKKVYLQLQNLAINKKSTNFVLFT